MSIGLSVLQRISLGYVLGPTVGANLVFAHPAPSRATTRVAPTKKGRRQVRTALLRLIAASLVLAHILRCFRQGLFLYPVASHIVSNCPVKMTGKKRPFPFT